MNHSGAGGPCGPTFNVFIYIVLRQCLFSQLNLSCGIIQGTFSSNEIKPVKKGNGQLIQVIVYFWFTFTSFENVGFNIRKTDHLSGLCSSFF